MADAANHHRRHVEFEVGDLVWLKLQPYRQHSVARPLSVKLSRRFYGPFEVLDRIGPFAYRLRLPEGSRIHNVFHVSLLKKFVAGEGPPEGVRLPESFLGDRPVVTPITVLDSKVLWHEGKPTRHVLVRWSDGSESTSWEPTEPLFERFPDLLLEDKEKLKEGGVVTNTTALTEDTGREGERESDSEEEEPTPDTSGEPEEPDKGEDGTVRKLRPRKNIKPPEKYQDYTTK